MHGRQVPFFNNVERLSLFPTHTLVHCQFYDDDHLMFQPHDPLRDIAAHFTRSTSVKTRVLAKLSFFYFMQFYSTPHNTFIIVVIVSDTIN